MEDSERIKQYLERERAQLQEPANEPPDNPFDLPWDAPWNMVKRSMKNFYDTTAEWHEAHALTLGREVHLYPLSCHLEGHEDIKTIVDAGCGSGVDLCCIALLFPDRHFLGYDLSHTLLQLAQKRVKRLELENIGFLQVDHDSVPLQYVDMFYHIGSLTEEHHFMFPPKTRKDFMKCQTRFKRLIKERTKALKHALRKNGTYAFTTSWSPPITWSPLYSPLGMSGTFYELMIEHLGEAYNQKGLKVREWAELESSESSSEILVFMQKE